MKIDFFVIYAANAFVVFQVVKDICCVRPRLSGAIWFPFVWASLVVVVCWKGTRGVNFAGSTFDYNPGSRYLR